MRFTIKLGGSILEDASIREQILRQIARLQNEKHEIILVHGGGKSLNRLLGRLSVPIRFVNGLRVTDAATLAAAVMVLAGEVNKTVVVGLEKLGARALGFCGADACAVRCVPLSESPGSTEGLGWVGRPVGVNRKFFDLLLNHQLLPVVSSLAMGDDYQLYNINADQMASVCAWGISCQALVYLTDVGGVTGSDGTVLRNVSLREIDSLRSQGIIKGGMLPKTLSCLEALERGVAAAYILPGASRDVLERFVKGNLEEGTCIHGNNRGD